MARVILSAKVSGTTEKKTVLLYVGSKIAVDLVEEVLSPLNLHGASQVYGAQPSLSQLVKHYCSTCALSRLLERETGSIEIRIQ